MQYFSQNTLENKENTKSDQPTYRYIFPKIDLEIFELHNYLEDISSYLIYIYPTY